MLTMTEQACVPACTGQFHDNFKVRLENALICGSDKASLDHLRACMTLKLSLWERMTGELWLCVDYQKINSVAVRAAFPLPCINDALQAVHYCQWFTSFDLVQGYLQMPVEEVDTHKTAIRAGSSGLYEFTHMPFRLSYSWVQFLLPHGNMHLERSTICNTPIVPRQHLCICCQHRWKVTPDMMKGCLGGGQLDISKTICCVKSGKKPMSLDSAYAKSKSRPGCRYLHQFS